MRVGTPGRSARTLPTTALLLSVAGLTLACGKEQSGTGPGLPVDPGNPQLRAVAFIADVNLQTGKIRITEPPTNVVPSSAALFSTKGGPTYSIVAGDVVGLTASNMQSSAVGEFQPGKIRITFDINISNKLAAVSLITPTFPPPPAGVPGLFLFPYEMVPTITSGGTSTGGDGTEVIVEQPSRGAISAAVSWDGSPHNFFNDNGCPAGSSDCFRYEAFSQPLAGGATSEARTVGFDLDATLSSFRARLIVSADLRNGP